MRWLVGLLLIAAACKQQAPAPVIELAPAPEAAPPPPTLAAERAGDPPEPPVVGPKTISESKSFDGTARLEQERHGTAACLTRCLIGSAPVWTSKKCIGTPTDSVFLSPNCEKVVLVVEAPAADRPWRETPVLMRYARGEVEQVYVGGPMLSDAQVEKLGGVYRWLQAKPRYFHTGAGIEFKVLTGRTTRLPFIDGAAMDEERFVNEGSTSPEQPRPPVVVEPPPAEPAP